MTGDRVQRSLPYFSPIPIWVLEQLSGRGKQSHLCIYAWLAHHADRDSDKCFVLYRTLAKESGYSERFVSKVCNELAEWGMLGITPRFGDNGGQRANEFTVMVYPPDARERTPLLRDDTPLPPRESTPPRSTTTPITRTRRTRTRRTRTGPSRLIAFGRSGLGQRRPSRLRYGTPYPPMSKPPSSRRCPGG